MTEYLLFSIFITLLGIIVGSFLNVVILRYNTGKGIGGRSMCLQCAKQLHWPELIPIISFFALRRRCAGCRGKVSWQYPAVELSNGILFLLLFWYVTAHYSFAVEPMLFLMMLLLYVIIWSLLHVIFVYDIKHTIIPDGLVYAAAGLSLVTLLLRQPENLWLEFLAGPLFFLPFYILWKVSKGTWIGLGDGKLALMMGWLLGWSVGVSALLFSFWIGAIFAIAMMLTAQLIARQRNITMKTEIPFAPFMIFGTLIAFFLDVDLLNITWFIQSYIF